MDCVLPVIDLKGGVPVHAIAGDRANYRPLRSVLGDCSTPGQLAAILARESFHDAYVADLDAIAGQPPNDAALAAIAAELPIWLDAGISDAARAEQVAAHADRWHLRRIIVGLESVDSEQTLREIVAVIGAERSVFSLDLRAGQPITRGTAFSDLDAAAIADLAADCGVERFIVLDLATVGMSSGPATAPLCCQLRAKFPDCELISGGGVRSGDDVRTFQDAGCNRVLVGSALHDGRLSRA